MFIDNSVPGQYLWNYDENLFYPLEGTHIIKYKEGIVSVDGIKVYEFQSDFGLLKISMPESDLESFVSEIGELSSEGEDIDMPFPEEFGRFVKFEKVKKIESLDDLDEDKRILRYVPLTGSQKRDNTTNYVINSYIKRSDKSS